MSPRISMMALLGAANLTAACGSDHSAVTVGIGGNVGTGGAANTGGASSECTADSSTNSCPIVWPSCLGDGSRSNATPCAPSGFPFVKGSIPHSDCTNNCLGQAGTVLLTEPKSGTLCVSGTSQGGTGTGIVLGFSLMSSDSTLAHQTILTMFNADALGITQMRFIIDNPPSGGVFIWADTLRSTECTGGDCIAGWFRVAKHITESGVTTTVPFTDFIPDYAYEFDTRALNEMGFDVAPGAFDYCLHDFQFLDASGAVVEP